MMRTGAIFNLVTALIGFQFRRKNVLLKQAQSMAKAGVEHIEIITDFLRAKPYPERYLRNEIDALATLKDEGITFSMHAPTLGIITGANHQLIREASVKTIIDDYELITPLEPTTVTIHPEALKMAIKDLRTSDPKKKKFLLDIVRKNEALSFEELIKVIPAEKICIENYFYGELTEYKKMIKKFGAGVTYDIGHYLLQYFGPRARKKVRKSIQLDFGLVEASDWKTNPDPFEFVDPFFNAWKGMVRSIHIHNVRPRILQVSQDPIMFRDHYPLTDPRGVVNIQKACQRFQHFKYNGPVIIEDYGNKNIAESISFLRKILEKIQQSA
ncbi:sugar phosphate isomerase/epimerase [Patescibacteria group bacterium AH-259-L07]|nr:sugar phosphate isomerase/epimerase [Patescibacteria group bacterium AH-259-L07]